MPYIRKTIEINNSNGEKRIFVKKYHAAHYQKKGFTRGNVKNKTPDEVAELNIIRSAEKLWWLILNNYCKDDIFLTLTYMTKSRPTDSQTAKKHISQFLRDCRKEYKKLDIKFKYIWVCEFDNHKLHYHILIPSVDTRILKQYWEQYGKINVTYLYENGYFKNLSEYLIKETQKTSKRGRKYQKTTDDIKTNEYFSVKNIEKCKKISGKMYNCSQNLDKPNIKREVISKSNTFRENPSIPDGWYLIGEPKSGVNEYGYPYFSYEIKKLE